MLSVVSFTFNPFQENTYLLINEEKECLIVDPGMYEAEEQKSFFDYIARHQLQPKAIINTHAHIDHIFSVDAVKKKYKIPFALHHLELPVLQNATSSAALYGFELNNIPEVDIFLTEKDGYTLGNDQLLIRLVPGHSPGSILFYHAAAAFVISGDVLFQRSIGRSDLPGGDSDTLIRSIKDKVYTLPGGTIVYPGHGPITQIVQEKQHNPFVTA